jgi:hypothetical protein
MPGVTPFASVLHRTQKSRRLRNDASKINQDQHCRLVSNGFAARKYGNAIVRPAHLLINPMCASKLLTLLQLQRVSVRVSVCWRTTNARC